MIEALISEGIERPSAIQGHAIPVLRRGNSAILRAGPGAGAVVAVAASLLDRLEPGGGAPVAVVLAATRDEATDIARSFGRLGFATGHRCAALGGAWALPGHADVLVATPRDVEEAVRSSELKVEGVQALVLMGGAIFEAPDAARSGRIVELLAGTEPQAVVIADPLTPAVRGFVDAHLRRAVFIPPEAGGDTPQEAPVQRGTLRVAPITGPDRDEATIAVVAHALDEDTHHVLLYFRSEDRAADGADLLALHGYTPGSPGDEAAPVWIGLDPLQSRERIRESGVARERVVTVSVDVPPDTDELDRRHGGGTREGVVVAAPREIPHLRRAAAEAGYRIAEAPAPHASAAADEVAGFRSLVEETLRSEDLAAYLTLIEPLLERWTAPEVAAAVTALLRRRPPRIDRGEETPSDAGMRTPGTAASRPPAFTRLFLSIGSRDGVGPGDLLGAITGEAGLKGDQVGRIDIRDTFSRVEVQDAIADEVIKALNGVTIRGRSVRADFDRGGDQRDPRGGEPRGGSDRGTRGPRSGGRPGDAGKGAPGKRRGESRS